jgi:hypothetical protein
MIGCLLQQPQLLALHGKEGFWAGWMAIKSARDVGIPWSKLDQLSGKMTELLTHGPRSLRMSRLGFMSRLVGLRAAYSLQSVTIKPRHRTSHDLSEQSAETVN